MEARDENPKALSHTPMWTVDELCAKLHTTPRVIHAWRRRGTAPKAYKIGRHLLFEESDVLEWLRSHESTSTDDDARRADDDGGSGW
ncbi:helix-turn-helix domain-containing protein [Antribacter sp. KLBMP9083]|uniref:Helix-turn-helix domain-containing protein n=1 Tax=Antribacter soli TaxID=2910976 RepID=A0AA41U5B9_9MICO|nr:helix-turn-helix domain-containing protein [Antribacter soli]MCF4119863.1 helix-turn-helix domain-containing protein [Antribacter soli]